MLLVCHVILHNNLVVILQDQVVKVSSDFIYR